ncbi:MAG TPA: flavin monoamine oxidase family protein [Rhodanobacteraceae bacterium]|nr:flavin monoamine oxidase family protein [Rhodanobacteraceae bacterium]
MKADVSISRRELLRRIGLSAGGAVLYHAMSALGFAGESTYEGPVNLSGAPRGASVLVLGAGIAGLVAAYELRRAGYDVRVLEYNRRAGGRAWTLRGGDEYTELGGFRQRVEFDKGQYFNPGPWRIPFHHRAILDYARRFKVPLEPFTQTNFNAYLHSKNAFGGKPQRYRHVHADFQGHVSELLGKAINRGQLDEDVNVEDREKLFDALRMYGYLDKDLRYAKSPLSGESRGYVRGPGGGLDSRPILAEPFTLDELVESRLWQWFRSYSRYDLAPAMFQPVGGMDRIANAVYGEVASLVQFGAKVVRIDQDERGVEVTYVDATHGGTPHKARAQWCVCTIPLSILSEIDIKVGDKLSAAIQAVPYESSVKIGLQFRRRFWEDDDAIYGGISYTDLPIGMIGYPMAGQNMGGRGVLLGAYAWGTNSYELTAMPPAERVRAAVEFGAQIHPQYRDEFENGVAVAWHRVPFTNGCFAKWSDDVREKHYDNLCQIDGRIVLAGEHASRIPAWQEGSVLSALDAIGRLHKRAIETRAEAA